MSLERRLTPFIGLDVLGAEPPQPSTQKRPPRVSDPERRHAKRPGRMISAFRVLMGRDTTPAQITADWIEWEIVLSGVLDRFGALLARQAKAEKKRVEQQLEIAPPDVQQSPGMSSKAELYARANKIRGLNSHMKNAPFEVSIPMPTEESP